MTNDLRRGVEAASNAVRQVPRQDKTITFVGHVCGGNDSLDGLYFILRANARSAFLLTGTESFAKTKRGEDGNQNIRIDILAQRRCDIARSRVGED